MKKNKNLLFAFIITGIFFMTSNVFARSLKIVWHTNGGSAVSDIIVCSNTTECSNRDTISGNLPTTLPTTTRTGYTFSGWYEDSTFNTPFQEIAFVSGDNPLNLSDGDDVWDYYAKWTAKTYTIYFDANGGTGGQSSNVTATYGSAMPAISTTAPTRTGYTFKGWYDAASNGTQYYTAAGTSAKNWNKTSNTTLYAQWESNSSGSNDGCVTMITGAIRYTISFETNGGSSVADINQVYNLAETGGEGLAMPKFPTKEGYSFKGWYAEKTFKNEITDFEEDWDKINFQSVKVGDCVKPEKTATLYAKWEKENETNRYGTYLLLVLDDNNKKFIKLSNDVIKDMTSIYENLKATKLPTPEKEGYTFEGWYVDEEYKTKVNNGEDIVNIIKEKGSIDTEGHAELFGYTNYLDLKIYAKWSQKVKTGNTGVSQSSLLIIIGSIMIVSGSIVIFKKRKN